MFKRLCTALVVCLCLASISFAEQATTGSTAEKTQKTVEKKNDSKLNTKKKVNKKTRQNKKNKPADEKKKE